jgi:hypothetical protein
MGRYDDPEGHFGSNWLLKLAGVVLVALVAALVRWCQGNA